MRRLSLFSYVIAGIFFLAAFEAFKNEEYESTLVYGIIGLAFILVKTFKRKKTN